MRKFLANLISTAERRPCTMELVANFHLVYAETSETRSHMKERKSKQNIHVVWIHGFA
jgi:hypothetical protein